MQLLTSDITACPVCGALLWTHPERRNYEKHRQWHIDQNEVARDIFARIHTALTLLRFPDGPPEATLVDQCDHKAARFTDASGRRVCTGCGQEAP